MASCSNCGGRHRVTKVDGRLVAEPCAKGTSNAVTVAVPAKVDHASHEIDLARALNDAGLYGWERKYHPMPLDMIGPHGKNDFELDLCFPKALLAIEVKGSAHRIAIEKVYKDCEREALLVSLGWVVLPVHKGMIHDGVAVERIRATLAVRAGQLQEDVT